MEQNQTAYVRIILKKEDSNHLYAPVEVLKVESFPLAFTSTDDYDPKFYASIPENIKNKPLNISRLFPRVEEGIYEMVGQYSGKVLKGEVISWKIENYKIYQLTPEEASSLSL